MKTIHALSVRALVAFVLLSLLAPIPGLAQTATPVTETPSPTEPVANTDAGEIEETSALEMMTEPTAESAPTGQRIAPSAEAPPVITLFGSTEPVPVPVGFVVTPEVPSGAYIASFRNAGCTGWPSIWSRGLNSQTESPQTSYFQARWGDDDSTRGNCLAVTWERISEPVLASEVCGDNNDVVTLPKAQPGISFTDTGWVNNERTVTLEEVGNYRFPRNQQTVFTFEDKGPCESVTPIMPVQTKVCGTNNDVISFASDQPAGVIVHQSESWSESSTWTVTLSTAVGYIFPDDTQTEYIFTDSGPCETDAPIPPVQTEICGTNNDIISFPGGQPANVLVTQSEDWNPEGTWSVTFEAAEDYFFPDGTVTEYIFTDLGPCETDAPIPPVQTEICGTNNDIISFPGDQPVNVLVTQSEDWNEDSTWTVTFDTPEHYKLPTGTQTEYVFSDAAIPCPTDAPAPPVQSAICGPDNDLITIPDDQPDGITLESDSGWENNIRTITFAVAPDFQTDGPTAFTFTDNANPCPIPTIQVTIHLQTSDGGSIEGSPWQLYAPVAAQLKITDPYRDGSVESNNHIVLDDLIAGQYRLVVNAVGYETIDETFTIADEEDDQIITVQALAIQASTETPAAPATMEPTPATTAAPVSGLPNTGSGTGVPGIAYLTGLVLIVAGVGVITRRPAR